MGLWKRLLSWLRWLFASPSEPPTADQQKEPLGIIAEAQSDDVRPAPRRRSARPPVIIGLDFGTHSTKVLVRRRGDQKARVVTVDEPSPGYPWFASPSLVRLADERLFFGREALERQGGGLYRSLKVHLLPPSSDGMSRGFPEGPTPAFLVACYLAWVLNRVKHELMKMENPPVLLNLAAPMENLENQALKDRYLRIVQAAWESSFGGNVFEVGQGIPLSEWLRRIDPLLERNVPDATERRYEVLPETVAPIVSLSLDPRMAPGMYMILDMGAGTTELSVDRVTERGADQCVVCYRDKTVLLGGDNFEWVDQLVTDAGNDADGKRASFEQSLVTTFRQVWKSGYEKDAPNHSARAQWKELTVMLCGGGAHRAEVKRAIQRDPMYPWWYSGRLGETTYKICWHQPTNIDFGRTLCEEMQTDAPLLAVAHGLSEERQQWPRVFLPNDIDPLERTGHIEQPPPYWYLDD